PTSGTTTRSGRTRRWRIGRQPRFTEAERDLASETARFKRHHSGSRWSKEEALDRLADPEPNALGVPSAELSLGWMLASRARLRFTRRDGETEKVSSKQGQPKGAGQEARQSVAKKRSFFVQRMGSTS